MHRGMWFVGEELALDLSKYGNIHSIYFVHYGNGLLEKKSTMDLCKYNVL